MILKKDYADKEPDNVEYISRVPPSSIVLKDDRSWPETRDTLPPKILSSQAFALFILISNEKDHSQEWAPLMKVKRYGYCTSCLTPSFFVLSKNGEISDARCSEGSWSFVYRSSHLLHLHIIARDDSRYGECAYNVDSLMIRRDRRCRDGFRGSVRMIT